MDTHSIIQIICIIILLALSAFFSSAETAYMTVNRMRLRTLIDEGNKRAVTVSNIVDNSGKMLSAILIGNNLVNISVTESILMTNILFMSPFPCPHDGMVYCRMAVANKTK